MIFINNNLRGRLIIQIIICVLVIVFYLVAANSSDYKKTINISEKVLTDSTHVHIVEKNIYKFADTFVHKN